MTNDTRWHMTLDSVTLICFIAIIAQGLYSSLPDIRTFGPATACIGIFTAGIRWTELLIKALRETREESYEEGLERMKRLHKDDPQ